MTDLPILLSTLMFVIIPKMCLNFLGKKKNKYIYPA